MDRRAVNAWCLYDWANSAFAATVMAALYPPFFRAVAQAGGLAPATATAAWGYVTAGALDKRKIAVQKTKSTCRLELISRTSSGAVNR